MPQIKTVSVTYERKFNLGDFNSAQIGITIWADVTPEDDLDGTMADLWSMAKENVRQQALPLVGTQKAQAEQVFLGLPKHVQAALEREG